MAFYFNDTCHKSTRVGRMGSARHLLHYILQQYNASIIASVLSDECQAALNITLRITRFYDDD